MSDPKADFLAPLQFEDGAGAACADAWAAPCIQPLIVYASSMKSGGEVLDPLTLKNHADEAWSFHSQLA